MDDMLETKEGWMSRGGERMVFRWIWRRYLIRCGTRCETHGETPRVQTLSSLTKEVYLSDYLQDHVGMIFRANPGLELQDLFVNRYLSDRYTA